MLPGVGRRYDYEIIVAVQVLLLLLLLLAANWLENVRVVVVDLLDEPLIGRKVNSFWRKRSSLTNIRGG